MLLVTNTFYKNDKCAPLPDMSAKVRRKSNMNAQQLGNSDFHGHFNLTVATYELR
jgi:hypothetical protein